MRDWNLTKTWSKGAWVNMTQNAFTYDNYGNQVSQLGQVVGEFCLEEQSSPDLDV